MTKCRGQNRRTILEDNIVCEAIDLEVGDTKKLHCPFCNAEHEVSFTITRIEEGLLYNCFRATCGAKGFISSIPGSAHYEHKKKKDKKKKFEPRPFTRPLIKVPEYIANCLYRRYEITQEQINDNGIKFDDEYNRMYLPVFDIRFGTFGGITKAFDTSDGFPKTINYFTRETSRLHYVPTTKERGGPIAVSEDILSAIKLSTHIKSVAALGHVLSNEQIAELRRQTDSLILMLDGDVSSKALNYRRKYGFYFGNFKVILMSKDPKDTPHEELSQLLGE